MNKVLFNGLLYSKQGAGISNYTKNIINNLINKENIEFLILDELKKQYENYENINFLTDIKNSRQRILTEQLKLLKEYKKYEVIHFPDYATPVLSSSKKIATIHDMAVFTVGECYTKGQVATKKFLLDNTVKSADKIICISNFTYNELKRYYPNVDDNKIEIIHNGFNKPVIKNKSVPLEKFNINSDYILFVGTISPSKNLVRLMKAFKEVININTNLKLVIVGKNGWKFNEVYDSIENLGLNNNVVFTGYVSTDELESLYNKSMFVVYPSLYEGFGLPPLEALSRGKTILVSNIPVLKEILGEAAFYCDPYNVEDIAKNMLRLINNIEYRNSKKDLAIKTVNLYSWEKCANETYKVYEKLMGE